MQFTNTNTVRNHRRLLFATSALCGLGLSAWAAMSTSLPNLIVGSDANGSTNPFVQPQNPALSGGGRDQTMQFGDVLSAPRGDNVMIGRLGTDVLVGGPEADVIIGGTEHFNPANRDRAFGMDGNDLFLWSPGDGSDLFDGGEGTDALVLGLMGELVNGQLVFQVSSDQQAGEVYLDPWTGLPLMDLTSSPGFCEVIDSSTSWDAQQELDALGLDHLVRFSIRSIADAFEAGTQNTDNGLRVTIHLKDVEVLVCTDRDGGDLVAYSLLSSPPVQIPLAKAASRIPQLAQIVQ